MSGSETRNSAHSTTLTLMGEDYTVANALCAMLNRNPYVEFCGASAPHPSDDFINIRIQTTGDITAKQALKQAAKDVKRICEHIKQEFTADLTRHRRQQHQQT